MGFLLMGRLFGTDGVRGIANTELTCELAINIGKAAAEVLTNADKKHPKILIGKDTRISSDMLEGALAAGLCSVGADVVLLGEIPTPAVAYLVKKYNADAGIMISASHNSFEFNGIKIFAGTGYKLPDSVEEKIEDIIINNSGKNKNLSGSELGKITVSKNAADDYINHVFSTVPCKLDGIKVAIDCSNGSASKTAEKLFTMLGAECHMLFDKPDGININDNCGSTHLENLQKYVVENNMCAGVAFDGDADRCLAVDEKGNIIDGDFLLAVCAADLSKRNMLRKNTVVGTVMANMGFGRFCNENNINFISTKVGDRYVLEEMLKNGYNFGGEQSGHVIFLDYSSTGDGQLTAAQLLSIIKRNNKPFSEIVSVMTQYPQVLINVKVSAEGKAAFSENDEIKEKIKQTEAELGGDGRVLVRLSGTEPLVRVMLEGADLAVIQKLGNELADFIKEKIGS